MTDRFEDLRTYVTLVDTGGVGAAASALGIAKSAVSRRLSDLEARLGVTLVARTTRSFVLTETGREFADRARSLLAELDTLEGIGSEVGVEPLIAAVCEPLRAPFLRAAATLRRDVPALRIVLTDIGVEGADVTVDLTRSGSATDPGRRFISTSDVVLCATPAYLAGREPPTSMQDVAGHALISVSGAGRAWTDPRFIWLEVPDHGAAISAVLAGAGIAAIPEMLVHDAFESGTLTRLPVTLAIDQTSVFATIRAGAPAGAAILVDRLERELAASIP